MDSPALGAIREEEIFPPQGINGTNDPVYPAHGGDMFSGLFSDTDSAQLRQIKWLLLLLLVLQLVNSLKQ